jgi:hypothetical protein
VKTTVSEHKPPKVLVLERASKLFDRAHTGGDGGHSLKRTVIFMSDVCTKHKCVSEDM